MNAAILATYVLLLSGGLLGVRQLRSWALHTYDTSEAHRDWSHWRDESRRQAEGDGPVARRPAASGQPPALVLARDYSGTLTVIFVLLGSVLFATMALLLRGAFTKPGRIHDDVGDRD